MKKYLIIVLLSLIAVSHLNSQPKPVHYNNWIFGVDAGITFTTPDGIPKVLELLDRYSFYEGVPSISDDDGELLYYYLPISNSKGLIKSGQDTVLSSSGIESGLGPVNPGLFIQDFTNPNLYYLITTPDLQPSKTNGGIYYNIIDRSKDGGKGEVILKNKNLYQNATEKMTAVINEVDNVCWVITHENETDAFKIIRIDENGLDENIITQKIGAEHTIKARAGFTGRLSMSPNGTTLASTLPSTNSANDPLYNGDVELFDFDPKTGLLSNLRSLKLGENIASTAFSPNGKILYVKGQNRIYQYDLTICDVDEMIKKRYIIDTKTSVYYNVIERGPNGIIYCGRYLNNYLDAILNPDIIGVGCNYTEDVVDIGGEFIWGLPTVINSYFTGEYDETCKLAEDKREYEVIAPELACLGDEVEITIKSNFDEDFEVRILKYEDYIINAGPFKSNDSVVTCSFLFERSNSIFRNFKLFAEVRTASNKIDTVEIKIQSANCCTSSLKNSNFGAYNIPDECYPVSYNTDMFFSPDRMQGCVDEIRNPGELKSSSSANQNKVNFEKTPTVGRILVGDPLPNVEQRAWYQNNATRIGTRYKFTASVCNVEKIPRFCEGPPDCLRTLDMWLGFKNRNQDLRLGRVDDIEYDDDWITLSGEFVAQDNYTELSIWVLGTSEFDNPSWGFGIDFVDLEIIDIPVLEMASDTTICIGEDRLFDNKFDGEITGIEWSPTTGLSNPNILNPVATPTETTNYTLKITDKYNCEFTDSVLVTVDSCLTKCFPCVSIFMKDDNIGIGENYCIDGEFIPLCNDGETLKDFSLYFQYNQNLMHITSASTDYQLIEISNKSIIELKFDDNSIKPNEINEFSICFDALLGDTNVAQLSVYSDEETEKELCLNDISVATIGYESCSFPLRKVKFFGSTALDVVVEENRIALKLTTEEQGLFKFVLVDPTGRIISQKSYNTAKDKYENEEIAFFELNDISSGVYFIRMQTPSGKLVSQKILITK